ncbi:MAG: EVE domain-containing protein [Bdellovibrionales bacterium]|nr:EVE domain-containing protein [Bdellovibrionales bacterium]
MKSEPETYSIQNLEKDKTTWWEGVRNYRARNFMMKEMEVGDTVLFYHSNCEPPGIVGIAEVSQAAAPDKTQFDKKSEYYDKAAPPEKPRWMCVQVKFKKKFGKILSLPVIKAEKRLKGMALVQAGQRLSVQPVTAAEYKIILSLLEK